jgi:hypothetical protein
MILFWESAKLLLVEQLHRASTTLPTIECQALLNRADGYQRAAIASLHAIAQQIVETTASGGIKQIDSVQAKMHFICQHANTALVVQSLCKAIEHTIDLNISAIGTNDMPFCTLSGVLPNANWIAGMKPLLMCLLTLDSTVSGALTARPALKDLMRQYGDIIMECWSQDDIEVVP